jgi:type IV pilus assembly protein PilO
MATPKTTADQSFAKLPAWGKAGLLALLVGLICAVYYFALHISVSDDIESAINRHRTLEDNMEAAIDRNNEYLALRQQLQAREGIDRGNLRALPDDAETASFLQDLNRLAELSGLRMRLVEPRPEEPEEHYVRLPVNLELTGRYHQLARFYHNVSRLDRLISMENIHLQQPRLEGEEVLIEVDVLATTFRRPAAEEAQPAAGAPEGS